MKEAASIYRSLQKHLNESTLGYPAVSSGAEIRILEFLFTPEEARVALLLDGRGATIGEIEGRIGGERPPRGEIIGILGGMTGKGAIEKIERDGEDRWRVLPLIVGMYEGQGRRIDPEFVKDFRSYTLSNPFGLSFLGTELPQMRTIPVGKSVTPELALPTYDELDRLVDATDGPILLFDCICRKARTLEGETCEKTHRTETCIAFGEMARYIHGAGNGRLVGKVEIREVLRQNQEDGLVLQASNTRKIEYVCSCCGCCCGQLFWQKQVPRPINFWASNYYAAVDNELCTGCGLCAKRCQVKAARVDRKKKKASVNLNRCIGCGVCVPSCKKQAIRLEKKAREMVPPLDADELNGIIMNNRKGPMGVFGIMRKMLFRAR